MLQLHRFTRLTSSNNSNKYKRLVVVTITVVMITELEEFRRLCEHAFGTLENLDLDRFF